MQGSAASRTGRKIRTDIFSFIIKKNSSLEWAAMEGSLGRASDPGSKRF